MTTFDIIVIGMFGCFGLVIIGEYVADAIRAYRCGQEEVDDEDEEPS